MKKEMTNWGIGLLFTLLSSSYAVIVFIIHFINYPAYLITGIPYVLFFITGIILFSVGITIWLIAGKRIDHAFEKGVLATQGLYGLMRHPVYGNVIIFTAPGILMFFRSWLLFTIPFFMYVVFRILIKQEDDYLEKTFGDTYLEYKNNVNAVFPALNRLFKAFFYPVETANITKNLYAVKSKDANFFIYADGKNAICIDTGYSDSSISDELQKLSVNADIIRHIFLTHTDYDHSGGLGFFKESRLYFGREDEQMINGKKARLFGIYRNPEIKREYTLLDDGDMVRIGKITVQAISVPGHTPGHTCYLLNDNILFTGDSIILQNKSIYPFYRPLNMNTKLLKKSIKKLEGLSGVSIICTAHTGFINTGEKEKDKQIF